jgi:hypothetical protein
MYDQWLSFLDSEGRSKHIHIKAQVSFLSYRPKLSGSFLERIKERFGDCCKGTKGSGGI